MGNRGKIILKSYLNRRGEGLVCPQEVRPGEHDGGVELARGDGELNKRRTARRFDAWIRTDKIRIGSIWLQIH